MKTIQLISSNDIPYLVGRMVIELNNDQEEPSIEEFVKRLDFFSEKRISMITTVKNIMNKDREKGEKIIRLHGYAFSGLHYSHSQVLTADEFVERFNNIGGERHNRLMTLDECIELQKYQFKIRAYQKIQGGF